MIDDILEFNKKFVESKGYEKYITNTAENTIPSTVGISNFRNNFGISILPKSILSFINFTFLFSGCKDRVLFRSKNYHLVISNYFFL